MQRVGYAGRLRGRLGPVESPCERLHFLKVYRHVKVPSTAQLKVTQRGAARRLSAAGLEVRLSNRTLTPQSRDHAIAGARPMRVERGAIKAKLLAMDSRRRRALQSLVCIGMLILRRSRGMQGRPFRRMKATKPAQEEGEEDQYAQHAQTHVSTSEAHEKGRRSVHIITSTIWADRHRHRVVWFSTPNRTSRYHCRLGCS